jgi:hypothetical protein
MRKLTLDSQLRGLLNGLDEQIEVCDETGKIVGYFVPEADYRQFVYAWLNAQVTDEELEQAAREPGGRTLAEIWKSLGRTEEQA